MSRVEAGESQRVLLASLVQGDRNAFWQLWRMHEQRIIEVCRRRMSGAQADIDDAISRAMFVALENMPEHAASILNVEAWLTRLCCNVCIDIQRERSRASRRAVSVDAATGIEELLTANDSPEEHCLATELGTLIARAIDELPPPLRDASRMRFIDEASYPEIARQLGISVVNARKRVQQSRSLLRERLTATIRSPAINRDRPRRSVPRPDALR